MSAKHNFPERILGEFIWLRPVRPDWDDAEFIYGLRTSPVARFLNQPEHYTPATQLEWLMNRPNTEVNYIIYNQHQNCRVGMVGICDCDYTNGVGSVGRLLLKEKYVKQGSPYGLEALQLCYAYVFNEMGMRKISGIINVCNTDVYRLQTYLGMTCEGVLRGHTLLNGQPQDMFYLSLMKEDFPRYQANIDRLLQKYRK